MIELTNRERQLLNLKFHSRREKCNACNFKKEELNIAMQLVERGLLRDVEKTPSHKSLPATKQFQLTALGYSYRYPDKK